jgi:hypothetical protein
MNIYIYIKVVKLNIYCLLRIIKKKVATQSFKEIKKLFGVYTIVKNHLKK